MTEAPFRLDHAPIVEAVLDINCDLPPSANLQEIQDEAKQRLRDAYPRARRQTIEHTQFRKEAEKPPEVSTSQGLGALQFFTPDEKQIIQFRAEGYSFNKLAPYSSLDDYIPEIERTWQIYRELVRPIQIRRIGLRFINRIPLPAIKGGVELTEYMHLNRPLPDDDTLEFVGFLNQHSAVETGTGNQVNITLVMQPLEDGTLPIIFDIDAFRLLAVAPDDWDAVRKTINSLRVLKNRVFKRTLTPKCLNLFQQQ